MPGTGWIPDIPSQKDFALPGLGFGMRMAVKAGMTGLPKAVDLRPFDVPVRDQGETNSCVGFSCSQMVYFLRRNLKISPDFAPSPLFLYYFARRLSGWETIDEGAYIRDALKVLVADGICREEDWPFTKANVNVRPPQILLRQALAHKTTKYYRMLPNDNLYHLKWSLAQGFPFVAGLTIYSSFMDKKVESTGMVPMPKTSESTVGGHAIRFMGYDDSLKRFICPNTWGTGVGQRGYYFIPYNYISNSSLADDFWTVRATT